MEATTQFMNNSRNAVGKAMMGMDEHCSRINAQAPGRRGAAIYQELSEVAACQEALCQHLRLNLLELHSRLQGLGLLPPLSDHPKPMDLDISFRDDGFRIVTDGMLPFQSKGPVYFLHGKLDAALEQYRADRAVKGAIFQAPSAVVFIHHYDTTHSRLRFLRDYDNLEHRCVMNVIARHFLVDDAPTNYIMMDMLAPDTRNYTEIRVMSIPDFRVFAASEKLNTYNNKSMLKNI